VSPAEIIEKARRCGVVLTLNETGTGLSLSGEGERPAEIIDLIKARKAEIVDRLQAERGRINRRIAENLIEWQGSCLQCRKPIIVGQAWTVVSHGEVSARFHKDCYDEWLAQQEVAAPRALGLK
jgi:hypothetical protein